VYVGDLHANQGRRRTLPPHHRRERHRYHGRRGDRGLDIDGPVLLPNEEDLPFISKPPTDARSASPAGSGAEHGVDVEDDMAPIQVVGSGATVNDATQNAFDRASQLLDMSEGEIRARCTFTGGVQIGRLPGVVQLDMLAPLDLLDERGLGDATRGSSTGCRPPARSPLSHQLTGVDPLDGPAGIRRDGPLLLRAPP